MQHTRRLIEIMARLRDPEGGCPWDLEQTFSSLAPYTLEEAYEVVDAVERSDFDDLRDELGDLLLQVVFHARLAEERQLFDFERVAQAIADKLVRRHPHVFEGREFSDDRERLRYWESSKVEERRDKGNESESRPSILDGIAASLPALMHAQKLQERAARHGFDWSDVAPVFDKLQEELEELHAARADGDAAQIREEVGDLLFAAVNLARHLGVDAETALKASNWKFDRRLRHVERRLQDAGASWSDSDLALLDDYWEDAKRQGL
jgi:MazG family protein